MARIAVTVLVTALLIHAFVVPVPVREIPPRPTIHIEAEDPVQLEMAQWAIGRFGEAGLALPDLKVIFPGRDLSLCNGAPATALTGRQPIEIRICWNDRFIVLHELAHAWEAHNLSDDRRRSFIALRTDVDAWTGADIPWNRRGIEHAANVIAWGLLESPFPVSRTYPNDPNSLAEAFVLLTEVGPLHDGGSPATQPDRSRFEGRSNTHIENGR